MKEREIAIGEGWRELVPFVKFLYNNKQFAFECRNQI